MSQIGAIVTKGVLILLEDIRVSVGTGIHLMEMVPLAMVSRDNTPKSV